MTPSAPAPAMNTKEGFEEFIIEMKLKLGFHQKINGDSWMTCPIDVLEAKLLAELKEYNEAEDGPGSPKFQEMVDVANICMMLYHRRRAEWINYVDKLLTFPDGGTRLP